MLSIKDFILNGTALTCYELLESEKVRNLDKSIGIDQVDQDSWTALHHTCHLGRFALTQLLLDYGASLDRRTNQEESPLLLAVKGGHHKVVELLLRIHKARIADVDSNGQNALHIAVNNGDLIMLQVIFRCCHVPDNVINQRDSNDKFPLFLACVNCRLDIITLLLQYDANPALHVANKTLLRIACGAQQPRIVAVLLQYGAYTADLLIAAKQQQQMPYDLGCRAVFEEYGISTYTPFIFDDYFGLHHHHPHHESAAAAMLAMTAAGHQLVLNTPFDHKTLIAQKDYLDVHTSYDDRVNVLTIESYRCMLEYGVDIDSSQHVIRQLIIIIAATQNEDMIASFLVRLPDFHVGASLSQALIYDLSSRKRSSSSSSSSSSVAAVAVNEQAQMFLLQHSTFLLDAAYIEPETGLTLLCAACQHQASYAVFQTLLQFPSVVSTINHRSLDHNTAILHLVKNAIFDHNMYAVLKLLIQQGGANVDDPDGGGISAWEILLMKQKFAKFPQHHEQELKEIRRLQDDILLRDPEIH